MLTSSRDGHVFVLIINGQEFSLSHSQSTDLFLWLSHSTVFLYILHRCTNPLWQYTHINVIIIGLTDCKHKSKFKYNIRSAFLFTFVLRD